MILNNVDLSTDGSETTAQFLLNLGEQAIDVLSGDIYIIIDDGGGFLSLSNDTEPSSPNNFDRNWINVGSGWGLISSGYPDFAGDFGILAGFIGVPGVNDQQSYALSSVYGSNNNVNLINENHLLMHILIRILSIMLLVNFSWMDCTMLDQYQIIIKAA